MDSNWLKRLAVQCVPAGLTIPLRIQFVENHVTGNYSSYDAAKAVAATLGTSFQSPEYARLTARNWEIGHQEGSSPLLSSNAAGVLMATSVALAGCKPYESRVLDWGGGDGNYFWLYKRLLRDTGGEGAIDWTVLETSQTVGELANIAAGGLRFSDSEAVIDSGIWRLILMNNALHIFRDPREILARIFKLRPEYVIVGDVPIAFGASRDRLAIVRPPRFSRKRGYSFPFWIFSEDIWHLHEGAYDMVARWPAGSSIVDGKRLDRFSYFFHRLHGNP